MTNQPNMAPQAPGNDSAPKSVETAPEQKQPEKAAPLEQPATVEPKKV